jgi:CHASE2 domain-containing sensor protein
MAQLVIFKIGKGDFERGFPVTLQIGAENTFTQTEIKGKLPPLQLVLDRYQNWQVAYNLLFESVRGLKVKKAQVTNFSIFDSASELEKIINEWLNSGGEFQPIRDQIIKTFSQSSDEIRLIIQAEDPWLWRLPWHLWNLLESNQHVEVALGYSEYKPVPLSRPKSQVRILVILGYGPDLSVKKDLELLKQQLPEADIFALSSPRKEELNNQLWEQDWKILFFAGHSDSEHGEGRLYINEEESLTIADLKKSLKNAIAHGLRLAIFNSCDGLGLAQDLADVQMPAIIVMRERVADNAAQKFLEFFLKAFAKDQKSLYASVREARERLQFLKTEYPCADWLPVICQNPAEKPLTWQDILEPQKPIRFRAVLLASMAVTLVILGMRSLGIFQPLELQAFDRLMQLRPPEKPDPRLLIIKVTEEEIGKDRYRHPLADTILAELVEKLEQYQPRVIGLDIYRDNPVNYIDIPVKSRSDFPTHLRKNQRLIAICKVNSDSDSGVGHLPNIPQDRLGFSNVVEDGDRVLRRHLLWQTISPTSPCLADYALSVVLAFKYLEAAGIEPKFNSEKDLELKHTVFKDLPSRAGMYQNYDDGGQQIMINYRQASKVAPEVTLSDIMNNQVKPELIKDKVILIGVTANSIKDNFITPLGEMRGLQVQAQMTSQILSAVLDKRPLLTSMSWWEDGIWIGLWSFIGGAIAWKSRSPLQKFTIGSTALIILGGISWASLLSGLILPVLPGIVAFASTGIILICIPRSHLKKISIIAALAGSTGISFSALQLGWILPIVPATVSLITASTMLLITRWDLTNRLKIFLYQGFHK